MNRPYIPYKNKHGVAGGYMIDNGLLRAVPDQVSVLRRLDEHLPDADGFIYPMGGMIQTNSSTFGQGQIEMSIHVQAGATAQVTSSTKMPANQQPQVALLSHRGMTYRLNWGRDGDRLKVVMSEDLLLNYWGNPLPSERAILGMLQVEVPEFHFLSMKNPQLMRPSPGFIMFIAEVREWAAINVPSHNPLDNMEPITYAVAQRAMNPKKTHDCHCDLYLIMREGCKCGGG